MRGCDEKIVLPSDDGAATYLHDIRGWVDRWGHYHGNGADGRRKASWASATHLACSECKTPSPKPYTKCQPCREKAAAARHAARQKKQWDGEGPVFSESSDEYFESDEEIDDYCSDNLTTREELRLLICDEVRFPTVDEEFFYLGQEDLDIGIPDAIKIAMENLNITAGRTHSNVWQPTKYAAILPGEVESTK